MLPDVTAAGAGRVVGADPRPGTTGPSPGPGTDPGSGPARASAISPATLRRVELAAGELATASLTAMQRRQPWFARLSADQRAGVMLVTQTGVANFVAWLGERGETIRLTAEAFRIAPRDLTRRLTLSQTVDLVRIATDVFERHLPPLAADEAERHALVESVLRFGREIAFAAATAYAAAAETRGAWDARLEALIVDAVVRGPDLDGDGAGAGGDDDALVSRAAALGWDAGAAVRVMVGSPLPDPPRRQLLDLRNEAARAGRSLLVGLQGARLVMLVSEAPRANGRADEPAPRADGDALHDTLTAAFAPGPVVIGAPAPDLGRAHFSAREALSGLRAAPGWPDAPRPVDADELLPERAVAGDPVAHRRMVDLLVAPLAAAGGDLLRTAEVYLEGGGALEACARALFVHPNTVRYRLRRVSELTGRAPTDPRDALVLRIALMAARMDATRRPDRPA
ncbi:PucR family transcriptional regulator [Pseudonocardia humida]|uniref:Helix-turn-helix domain-containing protein n=1 Tax=Pseudonocardia humida TaxID=2800819 RepID=A0ABT1A9A9_9PSEU|nr:helix-turn-helix domain-containing protein [Pseudonocardia humida]MCO1659526.1 helix-turn-helix domain-containing protein [Pseudonocardia humida]